MNWVAFILLAWVFLGLEKGLRDALVLGTTGIAPSFVFCLVTFIAMTANRVTVLWTAVTMGVMMDLVFEVPLRGNAGTVTIIGPHAVAYVLGVQLILALRGVTMRRNPLTMGFLACVGGAVAMIVLALTFSLRAIVGGLIAWETWHQLVAALGSAVYTGVLGILLAVAMFPLAGFLGLPGQQQRRFSR